jgi:hypothetical protein
LLAIYLEFVNWKLYVKHRFVTFVGVLRMNDGYDRIRYDKIRYDMIRYDTILYHTIE